MAVSNPTLPRKRKRGILGKIIKPILILLILFCLMLGVSFFFQVSEVRVTGNTFYTDEQIIEASGIHEGDNLVFLSFGPVTLRLMNQLPYVDEVTVTRRAPATVVISVVESSPTAVIRSNDQWYVLGRNCRVLGRTDDAGAATLIEIKGLTPLKPSVGSKLATEKSEESKLEYLTDLLGKLARLGMDEQVATIDLSAISNVSFEYMGRFKVLLGQRQRLEYKLELLETVVGTKTGGERGTIDLSSDGVAHFIPEN